MLAQTGKRVWDPTPRTPALIIIIDEYAELAESAPAATADSDSIARRGRALAVTLIAATQRPTQKAMGQGALRSQMDVRISFRVRERKDVDLVLGQGMLAAGWHAHTLNAPGKFLISAPEHDTPRRARAYLLTDDAVQTTTTQLRRLAAGAGPSFGSSSRRAPPISPAGRDDRRPAHARREELARTQRRAADPEALLWDALRAAPADGVSVADLMARDRHGPVLGVLPARRPGGIRPGDPARPGCWRASPGGR